jgi:hypothetical protein
MGGVEVKLNSFLTQALDDINGQLNDSAVMLQVEFTNCNAFYVMSIDERR